MKSIVLIAVLFLLGCASSPNVNTYGVVSLNTKGSPRMVRAESQALVAQDIEAATNFLVSRDKSLEPPTICHWKTPDNQTIFIARVMDSTQSPSRGVAKFNDSLFETISYTYTSGSKMSYIRPGNPSIGFLKVLATTSEADKETLENRRQQRNKLLAQHNADLQKLNQDHRDALVEFENSLKGSRSSRQEAQQAFRRRQQTAADALIAKQKVEKSIFANETKEIAEAQQGNRKTYAKYSANFASASDVGSWGGNFQSEITVNCVTVSVDR
jgi:hypothetical protein